jgi:hypothetical protein
MRKIFLQVTCLLLFAALPALRAQAVVGTFQGKVMNAQGKGIPNAAVTLTNASTNAQVKVLTGQDGGFAFNGVPPGTYHLDVETQGFKHATQKNLVLPPGGPTPYKITLQPGSMNETVEIKGVAPAITTDRGEVDLAIDTRSLHEIPVVDRNYQQLVGLQTGITPPVPIFSQVVDPERNRFFSAEGQAIWNNQWMMDGVMNQEPFRNTAIRVQPVESLQQLNIVSSTFEARHGFIGGSNNTSIMPGGTNSFHGTLYEFWNGQALNSRNFFDNENITGLSKPRFTYNQFGAAGGGAISRDRTFLFGSYQGMFASGQQFQETTVPTPAMIGGDFSAVPGLVLYNPNTGTVGGANRTPFAGNIIPTGLLSPITRAIASFYPTPNQAGFVNNFAGNTPFTNNQQKADARLDHRFSDSTHAFLRYGFSNDWVSQNALVGQVIGAGTRSRLIAQNVQGDVIHDFSANLIADFSFGYNRYDQRIRGNGDQTSLASLLGLTNVNNSLIGMNISGFAPIGQPAFVPENAVDNTFNWVAALSWHKSRHDFRFGVDVRRIRSDGFTDSLIGSLFGPNGTAYFGPGATLSSNGALFGTNSVPYNSFAGFLLGSPSQVGISNYFTTPTIRQTVFGIWAGYMVHPVRHLSIDLGIRYENYGSLTPRFAGSASSFDPLTNSFQYAGIGGNSQELSNYTTTAVAPRVGIAYRITDKTVIRAGYSIHYFQQPFGLMGYMPSAYGFVNGVQGSFTTTPLLSPFAASLLNPTPVFPPTNGTSAGNLPAAVVPLGTSTSSIQSYNIRAQREFYWGTVASVGYVGARGRHLPYNVELNASEPGTGVLGLPLLPTGRTASTLFFDNGVDSTYNSLQVGLTKRFSQGVSFIAGYTYAKMLGLTTNTNRLVDPFNLGANYAPLDFDQRHVFTLGYVWELPFARHSTDWMHYVLGGWQLTGNFTWSSGTPVTVTANNLFCGCINATPFANFFGSESINSGTQILNPASFATPVNTFGNIGRAPFFAPGFRNFDASVFKNFHVMDRYNLQFRGEFFNIVNTARFNNPVGDINLPDFGQQTSTVPNAFNNFGRQVNLGLRLMF